MQIVRGILRNIHEMAVFGLGYPFRHVAKIAGRKSVSLPTKVGPIHLRPGKADASSFFHIFVRRAYDLDQFAHAVRIYACYGALIKNGTTPLIIDAGANAGAASRWFALRYPGASIKAVEPDAENAAVARANTRMYSNVEVVEAAIGGKPGRVTMCPDVTGRSDRVQSTRALEAEERGVRIITIRELVDRCGPKAELFLVKVDIEGFESDLFAYDVGWLNQVRVVMIEPHDWMFPWRGTSGAFMAAMAGKGFEVLISDDTLFFVRVGSGARE